nr:NADH dehydrogenase subunit 6 [Pseudolycoriella hygida]
MILQLMIGLMMMIFSFIFMFLSHPFVVGFNLLTQCMLISLVLGLMFKSFWFSYILFLIFLGGVLVMFIYVSSLASNELMNLSLKVFFYLMMTFLVIIIIFFFFFDPLNYLFMINYETELLSLNEQMNENYYIIFKLYMIPTSHIILLLINYLFFTLVVVVKITDFFYGPIRMLM